MAKKVKKVKKAIKSEKKQYQFRTDRVEQKQKEGWKKVEGVINPPDLVLMEK
jgi:hypothetical protein